MNINHTLVSKIQNRKAVIGIIGLGYVGLPLVIRFSEENFKVVGFDVDSKKINKLNNGQSYIKHIPSTKIEQLVATDKFEATTDFSRLSETDGIIICVPTPLNDKKEPDMHFIKATAGKIAKYLRKGHLISLESTTYPGTTREILLPKFENNGFKVGKDFFLAFSPEREDPGNLTFNARNIPKVLGGITPNCAEVAKALYSQVVGEVIVVSSTEAAEFTKLLENIFRAVNIALVNELKILADRMNVDIWEVIESASTKPFGFMPFYPGPGLGGHCIPIDPFYLSWKAKELNFNAHFIELAGEVNTNMPSYVASKISDALNCNGRCFKDSRILILGVAYKKDTDDIRESPALELMEIFTKKGAEIFYNDPHIDRVSNLRNHDFNFISSPLSENLLRWMDAVIIVTDHSDYDYAWIVEKSNLVVDTRNATKNVKKYREKILKA